MVVRSRPYHGILTLLRGDRCVLKVDVGISYDAPFGPDGEDLREWQSLASEAADADYKQYGRPRPS